VSNILKEINKHISYSGITEMLTSKNKTQKKKEGGPSRCQHYIVY